MSSSARLTQGSIARHLVVQTAPMILGIACIMGVGLVDAWLIGLLGSDPLAAVSFIGLLVALCLVWFRDSLGRLFSDDPDIVAHDVAGSIAAKAR